MLVNGRREPIGGWPRERKAIRQTDWPRFLAIAATIGILAGIALSNLMLHNEFMARWGEDYYWFMGKTQRWLELGQFYNPHQLAGPYEAATAVDILYPPVVLFLFVPFIWLPAFLWWAIPLGILGWHIWTAKPQWWTWPILALLLWIPRDQIIIIYGSTGLWVAAFVALGLRFAWASPLVLFKPTFFPFALISIRKRAWWYGAGALAGMSLLLLPMWPDYVTAMRNNVGTWPGPLYSLPDYLFMAIPVIAWMGRATSEQPVRASRPKGRQSP
jgi:hypothetical protein